VGWLATAQITATAQYLVSPRDLRTNGDPYRRTVVWNEAALWNEAPIAYLRTLPAESVIVTNVWELVTFATGLPVKRWPDQIPLPAGDAASTAGFYLFWDPAYRSYLPPPEKWLARRLPLQLVARWNGAVLYRFGASRGDGEPDTGPLPSSPWVLGMEER
jgi:hypothetical protein